MNSDVINNYTPSENLLAGKKIIVTGAGDGIGKAVAITYAAYGATVILVGRTQHKLEQVYDQIEQLHYPQPAIFKIDFQHASEHDFAAMASALEEEFTLIDGLLHNASELGPRTPIAQYPLDAWQKVLQVNVTAPFMMTKALIPLMLKANNASIVFTSSSVGVKGRAYWGAYAMSKAALENLTQTLADELDGGDSIRVNIINPGPTRTSMRAAAYPAEDPNTVTAPEDLVNHYLYLMGPDSRDVNGHHIEAQK